MDDLNRKLYKKDLQDLVVVGVCFIGTTTTCLLITFFGA